MSTTKTTVSVTLKDGRKVTRTSARVYTHAVIVTWSSGGESVEGFASSRALAEKTKAKVNILTAEQAYWPVYPRGGIGPTYHRPLPSWKVSARVVEVDPA